MLFDLKTLNATLELLEEERKIPKEKILEAVKSALAAAYKKDYGKKGQIIKADFDPETGDVEFYQIKIVVDETIAKPEDEETDETDTRYHFDPEKHIWLQTAKLMKSGVTLEEELVFPLDLHEDFGRIAAQTAKQVIIQKIREAEKEAIIEEYAEKQSRIITGIVQKIEGRNIFVDFNRATGVLPASEQIPGEFFRVGQRIKVYLVEVQESPRGINLKLSRNHPLFIEELFKLESPEIASGTVEIKSIAREPGSRTKIAVFSSDENVDPIGACVGQKGVRVNTVSSEVGGEKIDIIPWSEDPTEFIASSLSPARVLSIEVDEDEHVAKIEVLSDQLSLAIGKGGQNVRLAAKLTGWRIDIQGANSNDQQPVDDSLPGLTNSDSNENQDEVSGPEENSELEESNDSEIATSDSDSGDAGGE